MYRIVTVIVAQISQNARDIYTRYDVYYFQPSGLLRLHMQNLTHLFALIIVSDSVSNEVSAHSGQTPKMCAPKTQLNQKDNVEA